MNASKNVVSSPAPILFDHSTNPASLEGPEAALPCFFRGRSITSLLDVGCGIGAWIRAATGLGIRDVCGVDGVDMPARQLQFPREHFQRKDLRLNWDLGRTFDAALCLEVAEHLDGACAQNLIKSLTDHAPVIFFSAACPGQNGDHHINCQWPIYWQELFNRHGFVCEDSLRWEIWNDRRIEPWYRQNLFVARRAPDEAGREQRISSVIHPDMMYFLYHDLSIAESGGLPLKWYTRVLLRALKLKTLRRKSHKARVVEARSMRPENMGG